MVRKPDPYLIDEDAPELTDEELASARPAESIIPADLYAGLVASEPKRRPGQRGPGKRPAKVPVTIRLEPETLAAYKASGAGWQTRLSELLAREAPRVKRRA